MRTGKEGNKTMPVSVVTNQEVTCRQHKTIVYSRLRVRRWQTECKFCPSNRPDGFSKQL
jgi:hypothetical protein